ncbi:hypothetical protein FSP39_006120 [Pinctada imbricata]|uniref:Uncharacterized protein n=1 Tax=Pinctada imbricata TaxID=66713 RepID=A0AA88Y6U0_PINIB|nr:hypothetical protein FSP39_006120 [Pinctada imbricata]
MKIPNVCLLLAIFVSLALYVKGGTTGTARIGLQTGKSLIDSMKKGSFVKIVSKIGKVSPYLNAAVSVFKLIFGLTSGSQRESAEMKYLRNLSYMINTRLDDVDAQISDMKKLIQWSSVQTPYLSIALKIRAVFHVYQNIFTVPISNIQSQKLLFIKNYESDYQNSGYKLFLGFVQDLGPFGGSLLDSAMRFYDNDRPKMRLLMTAMAKLLFMASQLELGYYSAKRINPTLIEHYRSKWDDQFNQIAHRMLKVDKEVACKWKSQYPHDIDRFVLDNRKFNTSHLSNTLYDKLSTKYFWRDWLVIVSDHINKHDRSQICGGYAKSMYGKDIIVTSVPQNKTYIEESKAEEMAKSLIQTCLTTSPYGISNYEDAQTIYSWFNPSVRNTCTTYTSVGIIYKKKNVAYSARRRNITAGDCDLGWCRYPEFERLYVYNIGLCDYRAHFFG